MARFLVTGGAGFIGSHLVHALVDAGHDVRVLDDLSTGKSVNLAHLANRIEWFEGSICDKDMVDRAMAGVDFCLHQAAVPSVTRSVNDPWTTNRVNVEGSINVFFAAQQHGVKRVVAASSSSVYGNTEAKPLSEDRPAAPISPYGVSKFTMEHYARVFAALYSIDIVCLRYFNVFGPRQDPSNQYAAVVPLFITRLLHGEPPVIHGDGTQARDFTFIQNVVEANMKACAAQGRISGVYNIACGDALEINALCAQLQGLMGTNLNPEYTGRRSGDIPYSCADISRARDAFGYSPTVPVADGLARTVAWYRQQAETTV